MAIPTYSCEEESPVVHVFDSRGESEELATLEKLHLKSIVFMEVCVNGYLVRIMLLDIIQ